MIDERQYNQNLDEHEGLIRVIAKAAGFTGADLDEIVQEIKLNYWKTRNLPRNGQSEAAYLAGLARKTCAAAKRKERRMMRDAPVFRFEERDTSEITSGTINGREIFKSADQERLADEKRLTDDLTALAGMMRPTHAKIVLSRLKADEEDVRSPSPRGRMSMLRESRRILQLPEDNPGRVEVTNPAAHVARVVRDAGFKRPSPPAQPKRIVIRRSVRKENACAAANGPTSNRENETTQVQRPTFDLSTESSSPSFNMRSGQRTANRATPTSSVPKRSKRSARQKRKCASSRLLAGDRCVPTPLAPTSRRHNHPARSTSAPPRDPRSALPSLRPIDTTRSGQ